MAKRRKFSDQFKAQIALEALRGDKTIQEIAAKHQVHGTAEMPIFEKPPTTNFRLI